VTTLAPEASPPKAREPQKRRRKAARATSLFANGEPMVWLTGGSLVIAVLMIAGLLGLVLVRGLATFWPSPVERFELRDGKSVMGEVTASETFRPESGVVDGLGEDARGVLESNEGDSLRRMVRIGNYELTNEHFQWISDHDIVSEELPEWAIVVERLTWGRFYGTPTAFEIGDEVVATGPEETWEKFLEHHGTVRERWHQRRALENDDIGRVNAELERTRLGLKEVELEHGRDSAEWREASAQAAEAETEAQGRFEAIAREIRALDTANDRYRIRFDTTQGVEHTLGLADVVRAYPANQVGLSDKIGIYLSRWSEYLTDEPREANSEGGVYPAIFGTVAMTLIMAILVVPFGVLAALYLREYAKPGPLVSIVRIAINNLAGVPSIVFGVFGLGFFCYMIGGSIDDLFYEARLPNPTFGKGGLLWASLTLALLTLPVVIVPTEEALAAVPSSMREGSYGCGATKWQTIRRIVLPKALPGIMTGMILALARGAGEVAPLMLVGAVKLAPDLPVDGTAPFVHPERSFMHLGFHIYDLGFQSQNSEAARPMVYTTTLLLISIVVALNLLAIWVRARLRNRYGS
jgi:phosphate transport system permease protein